MSATILESLSNIKLFGVLALLLLIQVVSFYIGAFLTPAPSSFEQFTSVQCIKESRNHLAIPRHHRNHHDVEVGKNCIHSGPTTFSENTKGVFNTTTFAVQLPLPRDDIDLAYSRWMQGLLVLLIPEFTYEPLLASALLEDQIRASPKTRQRKSLQIDYQFPLSIDVDLAVKNHDDEEWTIYARRRGLIRTLNFQPADFRQTHKFDCEPIQLFELQSLHYEYYLINLEVKEHKIFNRTLRFPGRLNEITGVAIHHNGGFTKIWLTVKTLFFMSTLATLIWYWRRLKSLNRKTILIERLLIGLGTTITQLNAPVELFSLYFEVTFMTFLSDLRQGIFYCVLLSFWIIFVGEHLSDGARKNSQLATYAKELLAICVASMSLLIFDLSERGIQAIDPFMTIWESRPDLANVSIMVASAASFAYLVYLLYYVYLAFGTISGRQSFLPKMQMTKRLKYQGMIYRFQFLLCATTVCAVGTLIFYGLSHRNDWTYDDDSMGSGITVEWTSAMFLTVCAMWNLYVIILMIFYAPSYKGIAAGSGPSDRIEFDSLTENREDEIELGDMRLLQELVSKASLE